MKDFTGRESKTKQHRIVLSNPIRCCFVGNFAESCADVKYAIENKIISSKTALFCVERNNKSADAIQDYLETLKNPWTLHRGEYHTAHLNCQTDNVFMDLYGGLTNQIVVWLNNHLKDKVVKDGFFSLTTSTRLRNSNLIRAVIGNFMDMGEKWDSLCELHFPRLARMSQPPALATTFLMSQFAFPGRDVNVVNYLLTKETKRSDEMLTIKFKIGGPKPYRKHQFYDVVSRNTGLGNSFANPTDSRNGH